MIDLIPSWLSLDIINGLFEALGGCVIILNVLRLHRDKMVRGVDFRVTGFFTAWGLFNMLYYPSLGQWWSFAGGLVIACANIGWVILAYRYRRN